jgi:hypothetical protein
VICPGDDEGHQQCLELGGSALGAKMVKNWVPNGIGGERHCSWREINAGGSVVGLQYGCRFCEVEGERH